MPPRKTAPKSSAYSFLPVAGRWAFLAGMVVAIVFGLIPNTSIDPKIQEWAGYLLMALGIIAGYLHISKDSQHNFILLAVGLAIFSNSFGSIPTAGTYIVGMLSTLGFFFGVAVIGVVIHNIVDWFTA